MARKARTFRILVATDDSGHARAAITTTMSFPWPAHAQVRVVAARKSRAPSILLTALDQGAPAAAERARRMLSRRWPDVEAVVLDKTPVEGILNEAERFAADVIVLGWRGHGAIRRLLMGSVSRGVVRDAKCAVLVARRAVRVRHLVVGLDGSATAKRAVGFVARLAPPADGRAILVTAVGVMAAPARRQVPGAETIAREVKRMNAERASAATRDLNRAAVQLQRAGWHTRTVRTTGEPLRDLLGTVAGSRAQLLVVGARGTSGVRHLLLGSVAEGALNRSPVPVLIAR
jgi:nucleotide-binding universal stress UspA family protein